MTQGADRPANPETILRDFLEAGQKAFEEKRFAASMSTLKAALELCDRMRGQDELALAIVEKLASATMGARGPAEAAPIQERVVMLSQTHYASNDPRIPAAMVLLGTLYDEAGRAREGLIQFERAASLIESLPDEDPSALAGAMSISEVLCRRGEHLDVAERLLIKAVRGLRTILGEDDPEAAAASVMLARVLLKTDRHEEAVAVLGEAIPALETEQPPREALAEGLMYLGQMHAGAERYSEAEEALSRAEAVYRVVLGVDSMQALGCLFQRGAVYQDQGKLDEAEAIYRHALAEVEVGLGSDHEAVANVADAYAELLESVGRKDEAKAHRDRARVIRSAKA